MAGPGRTKLILAEATKKLMCEKPFAKISVGDIVEECELNRNSFYYHFKDKYDLVNWIFYTEVVAEVSQHDIENASSWSLMENLFHYFYQNKEFYINALSVEGQNSFSEYYHDLLKSLIKARSKNLFEDDDFQDFYVSFFVDALTFATFRWLKEGANIPPEKLSELMKKATTGAAMKILSDADIL